MRLMLAKAVRLSTIQISDRAYGMPFTKPFPKCLVGSTSARCAPNSFDVVFSHAVDFAVKIHSGVKI